MILNALLLSTLATATPVETAEAKVLDTQQVSDELQIAMGQAHRRGRMEDIRCIKPSAERVELLVQASQRARAMLRDAALSEDEKHVKLYGFELDVLLARARQLQAQADHCVLGGDSVTRVQWTSVGPERADTGSRTRVRRRWRQRRKNVQRGL